MKAICSGWSGDSLGHGGHINWHKKVSKEIDPPNQGSRAIVARKIETTLIHSRTWLGTTDRRKHTFTDS